MGLVGVVASQLWYHIFIDGTLADLPSLASAAGEPVRIAGGGKVARPVEISSVSRSA